MSYFYEHKNGICLRKLEQSDLEMMKWLKDESWYGTTHMAIVNAYDQERWFRKVTEDPNEIWLIADSDKFTVPNPVGVYKVKSIDWVSRNYESAHDIFKHVRGLGFSKLVLEAGVDFGFEILNMHRLDAQVLQGNCSLKAALFAGFKEEGIRRKVFFKSGKWLDCLILGILREEWERLPRVKALGGVCHKNIVL